MAEVGESLRRDPKFGPRLVAGIEVLGVETLKESGVQLRSRIKTRTGVDAGVPREFNRRIMAAFEDKHILLAAPQMRLVLGAQTSDALHSVGG
jgi:small-conductance mechanosensitive channel